MHSKPPLINLKTKDAFHLLLQACLFLPQMNTRDQSVCEALHEGRVPGSATLKGSFLFAEILRKIKLQVGMLGVSVKDVQPDTSILTKGVTF